MFDAIANGLDGDESAETMTHHVDGLCRQFRQESPEPESVRFDVSPGWPARRTEAGFPGDIDDEDFTCSSNRGDT
ncbi:hypothetical protein ACKAMS_33295 [Rhodococcus sp. 5A-K4]|uniref:hypothetical protein n=1 Tax=Rhodococcus TaxID=1827 RepID=UPI001C4E2747|nr:hypothetical protein [Rhodococcus qingshengii]